MNYRIGFPFWKLAYKLGCTLTFRVIIHKGEEQPVYWCESPDIPGLVGRIGSIKLQSYKQHGGSHARI